MAEFASGLFTRIPAVQNPKPSFCKLSCVAPVCATTNGNEYPKCMSMFFRIPLSNSVVGDMSFNAFPGGSCINTATASVGAPAHASRSSWPRIPSMLMASVPAIATASDALQRNVSTTAIEP
eukprot:6028778-Prymnesium_polylepis.1